MLERRPEINPINDPILPLPRRRGILDLSNAQVIKMSPHNTIDVAKYDQCSCTAQAVCD